MKPWPRAKKKFILEKDSFVGFNAVVKRTSAIVTGPDGNKIFCAKGMVDVLLKTDPADEGVHQWEVANYASMSQEVHQADATLGVSGFKTLGVTVRVNDGPFIFAGILPIMDPPRHDTKATIAQIKKSNVAVKMITGDHHNIGKELARQIELGTDIRTPDSLKPASQSKFDVDQRDNIILHADGFAKVKPLDKHEVVAVLQKKGMVVGMTGDGVNDAPALAKSQIGIAVHGATDAAKSAGDIVLTKDGLSPIYTAVQISRRIFKRLKSYVIYRICITVQVVFFLAFLALFYNLRFKALYIILLALFHDLQIVTIAYDRQVASPFPETPTVVGLLMQSYTMGILMFVQTIGLIMYGYTFMSEEFGESYTLSMSGSVKEMDRYLETAVFLQISNSSAILILSARTVGFFFSTRPAGQLLFSTVLGQLIINVWILFFAGRLINQMSVSDVAMIWIYDVAWLLILDIFKMAAEAIWDKIKPWEIEHNPALAAKAEKSRMSRRVTNSHLVTNMGDVKRNEARKSGRVSVRMT